MNLNNGTHFTPAQDIEEVQATVLHAAIQGDEACRGQLPLLCASLEEPYRTVAAILIEKMVAGAFVDQNTIRAALEGKKLTRRDLNGKVEELSPHQAVNLICATDVAPGQASAYLPVLFDQLDARRRLELKERAQDLARQFGDNPAQLLREVETLAAEAQRVYGVGSSYLSESLKFLPYLQQLVQLQTGTPFLGLDSGFQLLNQITNGLDTGLTTIAARPSAGKTTLVWQICQQVAKLNRMPVLFISLEQSANELRAKALSRLSKLNSRHLARGRLRSDDPQDLEKLQQAAQEYFKIGPYLTIIEGDDTTSVDTIFEVASAKMARAGKERCLVAVDYLQILPLARADAGRITSARDRIDLHVSALRRMARQLDSPVIAISAENRAGYNSKQLDVFKESGGIEYSSDIAAILTSDREATRSAGGKFRVMDLNIVKNRNGEQGVVKFKFYPERADFVESEKCALPEEELD
jgi:replicative DNA helicase